MKPSLPKLLARFLSPRSRPRRGRPPNRSRPRLESLEDRTAPSVITWTNRGVTSGPNDDDFNEVFGAGAGLARSVVDAAINEWSSVITNLNGAGYKLVGGGSSLPVTISMVPSQHGEWAGTSSQFYDNGMPKSASIVIGSGDDGHGKGIYLDPNLFSSAFTASASGPFSATAQAGSPAANGWDLLSAVTHEMGHALGYQAGAKLLPDVTNTGLHDWSSIPPTGTGYYWAFVGPSGFSTLMTSRNGGFDLGGPYHAADVGDSAYPINFGGHTYWGTEDLMNSSSADGERHLITRNDAYLLRDAYGYTVNDPATALGTSYAQLDNTGKLWVRGRQDAASTDTLTLRTHSLTWGIITQNFVDVTVVQSNPVPGTDYTGPYTASFPAPAVSSIEIDTGAGYTTVNIQKTYSEPITVNVGGSLGAGITVGLSGYSLGVQASAITVNSSATGAFGTLLNVDDSTDTGNQTVTLSQTLLGGKPYGTVAGLIGGTIFYSYSGTSLGIMTGTGSNTFKVLATGCATNIFDNGPGTITIGDPHLIPTLGNIQGPLSLEDEPNRDVVTIDDSHDAAAHTAKLDTVSRAGDSSLGRLTGVGAAAITWDCADSSAVNVYFGSGTSTVNVQGTGVPTNLFLRGPTTINVGDASNKLDGLQGGLTFHGGPGTETLNVNDQGSAAGHTYAVTTTMLIRSGAAGITYDSLKSLVLNGSSGKDTLTVGTPAPAVPVSYHGGGGSNTLVGPNSTNTWTITGTNAGQVGNVTFTVVQNLTGGTGDDTFVFNSGLGVTGRISGGGGSDTLDYSPYLTGVKVNLVAGTATGTGGITGIRNVTGGSGNDTIVGNASGNIIKGNGGRDTLSGGGNATLILAPNQAAGTTVTGLGSGNTLQGANIANTWTLTGAGSGNVNGITTFSGIANLVGGSNTDTFKFQSKGSVAGTIDGGGGPGSNTLDFSALPTATAVVSLRTLMAAINGSIVCGFAHIQVLTGSPNTTVNYDTLLGPDGDTTWTINGTNAGQVGACSFSGFSNLQGGSGVNVYKFLPAGKVLTLVGGNAPANQGNWLDYSAFPTTLPVSVNLAGGGAYTNTGSATNVVIGISQIQNVRGGSGSNTLTGNAQGNILIGGTGADVLTGGSGVSLLIGGKGADQLKGGSGGDLLIGGSTDFDSNNTALMAILAEWQSNAPYVVRISHLTMGGGLNGSNKLLANVTVHDDGAADGLTGGAALTPGALDWFFKGSLDTISNYEPGELIN